MGKSIIKQVSFKQNEYDLIEYLKANNYDKNFSYYIKSLIRKDMNNNLNTTIDNNIKTTSEENYKKRNIDYDF